MTTDDIRALLDAAAKATPGDRVAFYKHKYDEWNVSLPIEGSTMRWALFDDGIRTERPEADAKFIAAASPDVVASLARIALAAEEVSLLKTAISHAATQGSEAFIDACIKLGLAENAMNDALLAAGLLTTAPQEPQP